MLIVHRRVLSLLAVALLAGCGLQPGVAPQGPRTSAPLAVRAKLPEVSFPNFAKVDERLYRGGVPDEADWKTLAKLGIKTDVDLQNASSGNEKAVVAAEHKRVEALGMKFSNLSLPWGEEPPEAMVRSFFETVSDPKNQPVFIHCKHGRDRTGTMVAAYRIQFEGITGEQALEQMKSFGFKPSDYPHYAKYILNFKGLPGFKAHKKELISVGSGL